MKRRTKASAVFAMAVAALSLAGNASAASIGANWVNNGNGGTQNGSVDSLSPTDLAGVPGYAQTNWNNLGRWGNGIAVGDSLTNNSGVDITWDAPTTANIGGGTGTPDLKLMYGFSGAPGVANADGPPYNGFTAANQPDARVRGLSAWLATRGTTNYSVIVYVDGNRTDGSVSEFWLQEIAVDGDFGGSVTLGADLTPHIFVADSNNFSGTYSQVSPAATSLGAAAPGNYILFTNLSADMFILRTIDTHATYAPMNAIQIVPEYTIPYIDVQPEQSPAGALFTGQSFSMTVLAAGPSLNYQWRKDGTNLSGQISATYSASNITTNDSGNYDVLVSNSFGSVTSSVVAITVNGDSPPANATVTPASATRGVGGAITFTVTATGSTPFTYQWQKGGTALTGQTNSTLVLNNLTLGDAGSYTCGVTNFLGGTLSSAGVLTVNAVAGTTFGLNFVAGSEVVSATALGIEVANWTDLAGANGGASVSTLIVGWTSANLWQQGTFTPPGDAEVFYGYLDDGGGGNTVTISNLTSVYGAYVVQALGATDFGVGLFDVTITNGPQALTYAATRPTSGELTGVSSVSAPLYDDIIKLTGLQGDSGGIRGGLAGVIITDKPVIVASPQGPTNTIYSGQTVSLTGLNAIGVPLLSYQWRRNGSNLSGETNTVYTIPAASTSDDGNYDVVVANAYGSATSSIVAITVSNAAPFNLVVDPPSAATCVGGTIVFTVTAEGSVPFTYQWYKGAAPLAAGTNAALVLTNLQVADADNYSVAVTNAFGGVTSAAASLSVSACAPTSVGLNFSDGTETVTATAFGIDSANWYSTPGANGSTVLGPVFVTWSASGTWRQGTNDPPGDAEVLFGYLDDDDGGNFVSISGLAAVFPVYVVQTLGATDFGTSLQNVTLNGSEVLTYVAQTNGSGGLIGHSISSGALYADTLTIQGMQGFSGNVRGGLAGIIITDRPIIANQPQGPATAYSGGSFSLTGLNAVGVPTLTYQWRKDGTNITGGGATYTKSGITTADSGNYDVVVANSFGSVTSSVVAITVVLPPSVTVSRTSTNMTLSWPDGILLEATNILGPWTTNAATSPYTFTPTEVRKFYRLQLQ